MATVAETELQQKMSEFIQFVKDFAANRKEDFKVIFKPDGAILICNDRDVTMDFSI